MAHRSRPLGRRAFGSLSMSEEPPEDDFDGDEDDDGEGNANDLTDDDFPDHPILGSASDASAADAYEAQVLGR